MQTGSGRHFIAQCPKCQGIVNGHDDWSKGDICILGLCSKCGEHYLEEELDWADCNKCNA